jgi:hypothetical protein
LPDGGDSVLLVNFDEQIVRGSEWEAFLKEQDLLLKALALSQ